MAKSSNSLIGLRGKVRDLVFRETKFGTTVSGFNSGTYENKKWSGKQKGARAKFSGLCKLAQVFRKANDLGFRSEMTYMSQPCFVRHNYAALEVASDGGFIIDYKRVCMSHGTLALLSRVGYRVENGILRVQWSCGDEMIGDKFDRVAVMMYCLECKENGINVVMGDSVISDEVTFRSKGALEMKVPKRWDGLQVYCYVFTFDDNGKSSDSQFVGEFKAELPAIERTFEIQEREIVVENTAVFEGVEQRNEPIEGKVKRCFVIKFRDDDELIEEVLVEPTDDDDFVGEIINGIRQPSKAEQITLRLRELIREVNPKLFAEKYSRGEEFRAESWCELCEIVTQAVEMRTWHEELRTTNYT